jgi:hypothetical protein
MPWNNNLFIKNPKKRKNLKYTLPIFNLTRHCMFEIKKPMTKHFTPIHHNLLQYIVFIWFLIIQIHKVSMGKAWVHTMTCYKTKYMICSTKSWQQAWVTMFAPKFLLCVYSFQILGKTKKLQFFVYESCMLKSKIDLLIMQELSPMLQP